jgi:histidinol-phosphatase (PHP family)
MLAQVTTPRSGSAPLPPDDHVHSEWSWDAVDGSMERTCARAVEIGLRSLAFTEHVDLTPWWVPTEVDLPGGWTALHDDGLRLPPPLDVEGYLACLDRCREAYPSLRIVGGVELSEPHWHQPAVTALLARGGFDRVLASVHSARVGVDGRPSDVSASYPEKPAHQVVRDYLAETVRMVTTFDGFEVLAHIDYPVRYWPASAPAYDVGDFEDDYREALRALASTGRALEVNTRLPLHHRIVQWWHDEGGTAITFASDAHEPSALGRGFLDAVRVAEAAGFRARRDPYAFWGRA